MARLPNGYLRSPIQGSLFFANLLQRNGTHPSLGVLLLDLGSYRLPSLHQLRRCPQPLRYIQSSLLPSARSGLNPHSDGVVQDREGLSSAFGLMSLDDSEVLAGLVNDAPFFDNAITNDSSSSLNPS